MAWDSVWLCREAWKPFYKVSNHVQACLRADNDRMLPSSVVITIGEVMWSVGRR